MPIIKGTTRIGAIYKGTTPISAIYKGTTLIFSSYVWENYAFTNLYNSIIPSAISSKNVLDKAKISKIYANGVIENQLVQNGESEKTSITAGNVKVIQYQFNCVSGHKYLCSIFTKTTGTPDTLRLRTYFSSTVATTITPTSNYSQNNIIVSANQTSATGSFEVQYIKNDSVFDGDVWAKECEIFDLTLMFGTGNEPTTLTDNRIQKLLNRGYIDYNAGSYKGTDISEFSSEPYNLLGLDRTEGTLSGYSETTLRDFDTTKYYIGLNIANNYAPSNVSLVSYNSTSFTLNCSNGYGIGLPIIVISGKTYTIEYTNSGTGTNSVFVSWYDVNGKWISYKAVSSSGSTATAPSEAYFGVIVFRPDGEQTYSNICFHETGTRTGYAPHTQPQTLSLRYQGNGALSAHDTLEITDTNWVFTKNVGVVDLATLTWTSTNYGYSSKIETAKPDNTNSITEKYMYSSNFRTEANTWGWANNYIGVNTTSTPTGTLYYELATPQVITIPRKRLGVVDMGSLNWNYETIASWSIGGRFYINLSSLGIKTNSSVEAIPNIYQYIYNLVATNQAGGTNDNVIYQYQSVIYIHNSQYNTSTLTDFKNSLSGVYLFYETNEEVADITTQLGIESGGTLTSDSLVLPNVDTLIKCK